MHRIKDSYQGIALAMPTTTELDSAFRRCRCGTQRLKACPVCIPAACLKACP